MIRPMSIEYVDFVYLHICEDSQLLCYWLLYNCGCIVLCYIWQVLRIVSGSHLYAVQCWSHWGWQYVYYRPHLKDDGRLYFQSVHTLGGSQVSNFFWGGGGGSHVSDFQGGSQVSNFFWGGGGGPMLSQIFKGGSQVSNFSRGGPISQIFRGGTWSQ